MKWNREKIDKNIGIHMLEDENREMYRDWSKELINLAYERLS